MLRQRQWQTLKWISKTRMQRLSAATINRQIEDEGDWFYSSEWWGSDSDQLSHSVLRAPSLHGNGVVSVLAYPSSKPSQIHWAKTEKWLQQRSAEICSGKQEQHPLLKVLGYQWRVLRFNDITRQSTAKVMVVSQVSDPGSVYYMQQAHCLAVPYVKSMVSAGLTTLSCCNYDLWNAVHGRNKMRVLCVGHGGGSLPLFLASKIQGAIIDIVEIDPLVISTSISAMGFPSFSVATCSGHHLLSKPSTIDDILWRGVHERIFLYESDAEKFLHKTENLYDIIFIDAYDGDDIFPHKFWDPDSPFLEALGRRLHPYHGTVVVNLHSDDDILSPNASTATNLELIQPIGKYVSRVCRAYKDVLVGENSFSCGEQSAGLGFVVSVPWVCNTTLVVCRGFSMSDGVLDQDLVLSSLFSKSFEVERDLDLPFSCSQYLKGGFALID